MDNKLMETSLANGNCVLYKWLCPWLGDFTSVPQLLHGDNI